jgi:hypothetical protein
MIFSDKILLKKECVMQELLKFKISDIKLKEFKIKIKDLIKKTKDLPSQ